MKLFEKHEARIYTDRPENIAKIEEIIKEIDNFEYEYLPHNLIAVFNGKIDYVYNGKFYDIDMDEVMKRCWEEGIYAFYVIKQKERIWI